MVWTIAPIYQNNPRKKAQSLVIDKKFRPARVRKKPSRVSLMVVFGNFLGICLLTAGILVVLYAVVPITAWIGLLFAAIGSVILTEIYRDAISKNGLRVYLPKLVNDYLTRTDMVETFVTKLRENGAIPKMFRIMRMSVGFFISFIHPSSYQVV